ncbi:hypothetical protein COF68_05015 [Bacillus toyonensis]|uniref:hypothetical protein n=1 Tax=Bacillus toyonensis TaxID=155322 RepID=UPI000BFBD42E|nr:hypothetical protein [Bacillus toyonensis]PHE64209.1 hypothetical protein COF68_05015 [Bacillus toyonensis]
MKMKVTIEQFGVEPRKNYLEDGKILKATLVNGLIRLYNEVCYTFSLGHLAGEDALTGVYTDDVLLVNVANIEIVDKEYLNFPRGLETYGVEQGKDYETEGKMIKVTILTDRTLYFKSLEPYRADDFVGKLLDGHTKVVRRDELTTMKVVNLVRLEDFGVESMKNYLNDGKTLLVSVRQDIGTRMITASSIVNVGLRWFVCTDMNGEDITLNRENVTNIGIVDNKNYPRNLEQYGVMANKDYSKEGKLLKVKTKTGILFFDGLNYDFDFLYKFTGRLTSGEIKTIDKYDVFKIEIVESEEIN